MNAQLSEATKFMFPTATPTPPSAAELARWMQALQVMMQQAGQTSADMSNNIAGAIIVLMIFVIVSVIAGMIFLYKMTDNGRRSSKEAVNDEAKTDKITAETYYQGYTLMSQVFTKLSEQSDEEKRFVREDAQKRLENDVITNDILYRLQDTQNKIAETLVELKNQGRYANDESIKSNMLLASLSAEVKKVAADTPLLPHLQDVKAMVGTAIEALGKTATRADVQAMQTILMGIYKILSIDINEMAERKSAAERIGKQLENAPVVEDIPEPLENKDNHELPPTP